MRLRFQCNYCGALYTDFFFDESGIKDAKCVRCGDKNVKPIKEDNKDVFGYNNVPKEDAYIKRK